MAAVRGLSLKNVSWIKIAFSPFDKTSRPTAAEFYRRVTSREASSSNPKCKVTKQVQDTGANPVVEVLFNDKENWKVDVKDVKVLDLIAEFNTKCRERDPK